MKKVMVVILIIFAVCNAYTQDLIMEIQKLTLANDSLQKQVIKPLNDSILKLNSAHSIEIAKLNEQLRVIEIEKSELNKTIKTLESTVGELNKNKIKVERDNLKRKCDSLIIKVKELENLINAKDKQIAQELELGQQKSIEEKEKGKGEILNLIIQTYNKPLDELIINTNIKSVDRDMSIVGDKTVVYQKLVSLQKYYNSELVLNEKYNEQRVENALTQLKSIEQTELVIKLIDKLSKYKLCSEGLKTTIDKILEIDKKFVANDDYTQKTKLNDVLAEIAWYFRNYRFNFIDYPYLSEVVLEIIKLKQKDANTDIAILKEKL
ncbi:MAG: hypothetical protein IPO03_20600 [Bacteroidetes bacterium]|nr:hypothetical protein [Bacteroidota bacterium]